MKKTLFTFLILTALIWMLWPRYGSNPPSLNMLAKSELNSIRSACLAYRSEFGVFPTGTVTDICHALSGTNSMNLKFIEIDPALMTTNGVMTDPWQTPFSVSFPDGTSVVVRSAGKDKMFGTQDDIEK